MVGKSDIKFKGRPEITLTITSRNDFLKLGGKYTFSCPLAKLNGDYLVKTKKTSVTQSEEYNWFIYEYELTNSFDVENELNYFDNQRSKANGNISQGEYIARNVDIENTALIIFDNAELIEVEMGDNILNAPLNAPFTQ